MEPKEYLTYEETQEYLKIGRSTLRSHLHEMGIHPHKFKGNKHRYIAFVDVERIKKQREVQQEKPWEEAA